MKGKITIALVIAALVFGTVLSACDNAASPADTSFDPGSTKIILDFHKDWLAVLSGDNPPDDVDVSNVAAGNYLVDEYTDYYDNGVKKQKTPGDGKPDNSTGVSATGALAYFGSSPSYPTGVSAAPFLIDPAFGAPNTDTSKNTKIVTASYRLTTYSGKPMIQLVFTAK